ncbi:MAG: acyltransferase domain-containing protein [Candidatus Nanopelagicales bacterium]|nr:acyltransferase domain-containing protein [Candidatus Nanopelagicales bacterium]
MLVVVAPGQGAQTPGFLTPWLDVPGVAARLEWLSVVSGIDLIEHGTRSDAETIRDTAIAQPLLVGAGLVTLLALFPHPAEAFTRVSVGAGHSVGEITAATAAGVLTAEQAMVFVRERGRAMANAAALAPTGMSAVLGGDTEDILTAATALGLTAANMNGAGQIVLAGSLTALAQFADSPPEKARVRPLQVAGAFHTDVMAPAVEVLKRYARSVSTHDSRINLLSNADGRVVHDGRDVLRRLVSQVSRPVRWDLCMSTMADLGVTALIEIPPAGTLTGLAKRALPGVDTVALNSPDDLDAAWALVERHGIPSTLDTAPTWRLIISPMKGTFHRAESAGGIGERLAHDAAVGLVTNLRDSVDVVAPHGGTIVEWIVEDGDPVAPGQPIVRLHPTHEEVSA